MYKYVYVYKWRSNVKKLFDLFTPTTAEVTKSHIWPMAMAPLETSGLPGHLHWIIFRGKE